ncbi:MAG: hypothetical protein COU07_00090 [Candidatus Harrisonbacteria bacterium CG10_big_fil_rev_8_21_14_0_10_40_38]|uniref:UDP-glucose/GDP-mannose dehydrogenase C-terminal domain-containing protein n=1 Tax=Candidatus Harrisonbacteria bacterium CG10_big_fil_rev_8_21_14_0_10_40_38 TaxID=1974583 RepID=A0A2H0US92_9BACT|nr:MAG: hypothetical protein COU07_00090 [Candidatus Harrisonbacteria bacterium CG10_big_fil_rev_8_21_14_0_10_40_38]
MQKKLETVAVVGLGYVGLPLALLVEEKGYKVIGIDIDEKKVKALAEKRKLNGFEEFEKKIRNSKNFFPTNNFDELKNASIIIVAVPTPTFENHQPNLLPLTSALEEISKRLDRYQHVIIESTINPGVCEQVVIPLLEKASGLKVGKNFYVSHCPERIDPGNKNWDVEKIPRVIGSADPKGLILGLSFYKTIISAEITPMKCIKEAEAVKVVENSFRDINIAFVNELAMSFSKLGIDIKNVIKGASTKPFAFMAHDPGCGVGGHCIPVDPYYLITYAKKNGFSHKFLSLARKINNNMPVFTVNLLKKALKKTNTPIKKINIGILGLAYKPNVSDTRESPALEIIKNLQRRGINVLSFDPYVKHETSVSSLKSLLKRSNALILVTAHKNFLKLKPSDLLKNKIQILVDGRNALSKEKFLSSGIVYQGIGR